FQRHIELIRSGLGRNDTGPGDRRQLMAEKIPAMPYDELLNPRVAFGTAPSLRERLGEIAEDLGLDGIVAELNPSGLLSLDQMKRTLAILTREVIPTFRGRRPGRASTRPPRPPRTPRTCGRRSCAARPRTPSGRA